MGTSTVPACAVVLAAGEGTRMKSPLPKVLHRAGGRTLVDWVLGALKEAGIGRIIAVVGFRREAVIAELEAHHPDVEIAVQEEQLGTGHAVGSALPLVGEDVSTIGVFSGDTPLLSVEIVRALSRQHHGRGAAATLLTAEVTDPSGYGRIVRDADGLVEYIVEEADAGPDELMIREINAGAYIFEREALTESLGILRSDNAQGEYYLTDTVAYLRSQGLTVAAFMAAGNTAEVLGINTIEQLMQVEVLLSERGRVK